MRSRSFATFALVAVVAGCESSDPVTPQIDLDAALSAMSSGAAAYADFGMGASLPSPATSASACAFEAASGFFVCPSVTSNGITFTRQFQLRDAGGAPLSSINPLLVSSIRAITDINGTVTNAEVPMTFQITRHDDAVLAGVQSADRVLDGTATQQLIATAQNASITMNDTTVTTQLRLPSTPQQKYPLGGSVVASGAIHDDPNPVYAYRVETTFDGTSFVTINATSGGETWSCRVNLAAPNSTPICS